MRMLDEVDDHWRHVERSRQEILGERRVAYVAVLKLHFFHHREAETLCDASLDLTDHRKRVERLPDILRCRDLHDLDEPSLALVLHDPAIRRQEARDVTVVSPVP